MRSTTFAPLQLQVMSLLGDLVATLPTATNGQFMTDGSVAACVDPPGDAIPRLVRWDLFSDPTPYATSKWPADCTIQDVR